MKSPRKKETRLKTVALCHFAGVKPISPWRLKQWLRLPDSEIRLIDVRTPFEYKWFHIENAENRSEMAYLVEDFEEPDPDKPQLFSASTETLPQQLEMRS